MVPDSKDKTLKEYHKVKVRNRTTRGPKKVVGDRPRNMKSKEEKELDKGPDGSLPKKIS